MSEPAAPPAADTPAPPPKLSAFRRLASESVVYGLSQAGGRAVQLLLVPVLTRALTPEAYGVSELIIGYSQTMVMVLVLGMDGALARFFYGEPDQKARAEMVSTSFLFRVALAAVTGIAAVLWAPALAGPLIGGEAYAKYVRLGAITLPFTLLVLFGNDVLRVTFQPWKFLVLNLTQTVLVTAVALHLVVRAQLGVAGVLYGRLAGDALAALVAVVLVRHYLAPRFRGATLRRMLAYGAPTVPALIVFGLLASLDRFVLQRTRSLEELAVYAVAMKFFTVVTFAASAFQLAYGPFVYANAKSPDAPRIYARALSAYVGIGSAGALLVGLFAPEALAFLAPPEYAGAAQPALLLAFAAVAFGAYTVAAIGIGLSLKTAWSGVCAAGALLVAVATQLAWTPRLGVLGAAAATWTSYVVAAAITYVVSQRLHPLPYRGARLLTMFVLATAFGLAGQRWTPPGPAGAVAKLVIVAAFAMVVLFSGVWNVTRPEPEPEPEPETER